MIKSIQLLKLLSGNRKYTVREIMERFNVSERTVYRYFNQIENTGFVLDRSDGRYRLAQDDSETKRLHKLFHFTEEEAFILHNSLSHFEKSNNAVRKLIKKLHALYDFQMLVQLKKDGNIKNIERLSEAMKNKNRVLLLKYRSSNSATESDRMVEPFEFMADYESVWCLDLDDKTVKQFRISRIDDVEILNERWGDNSLHRLPFTDAFRMSAFAPISEIKARLSLKAYNLLREEFPLAEGYLKKEGRYYYLKIPVADYHGIGRFVLGLPGDVKVLEPVSFMDFLKKMREKDFD